uniref:Glycosyltransferase 2-like domain-containing protein n=1 Tax=Oryzias latipes TaxID=8090 RepID=A0A3B3IBW0_ORYLA
MKLRRKVAAVRRRMLCLWLLLLGLSLAMLGMSDFLNHKDLHAADPSRRPLQWLPSPPELEVIVDSLDPAMELGVDTAPLKSLQEDQLLFVFPSAQGTWTQQERKRSYKMFKRGTFKDATAAGPLGSVRGRTGSIQMEMEQASVQRHGFNEALSETISLHRRPPEARHPDEILPSASVVICFHEEPWSTLMRTVHSVLDTSPRQYLQEVLLVDDLSQNRHLKARLGSYVSGLDGVRLIHSTRRLGVGGCRTMAAAKAKGQVLVFMDSHCECHEGWLEPLLERVSQDSRVVSPVMDVIDWKTFQYNATQWPVRGVFDWRLDFYWELNPPLQEIPPEEATHLYFIHHFLVIIQVFTVNLEQLLEFYCQVWSCGGSMEVVPCSRVAHLSRHHLPYIFPDQEMLRRNKIRVADIWMDAYKKIYYRRDTLAHLIKQSESPNIAERLRLKRSLGCRNFHWFLSTVYPQLYVPQDKLALSGEVRHTHICHVCFSLCSSTLLWGSMGSLCMHVKGNKVVLSPCSAHQPTNRGLKWKFIKARQEKLYSCKDFMASMTHYLCFTPSAERTARSPAVSDVCGGCSTSRPAAEQNRRST